MPAKSDPGGSVPDPTVADRVVEATLVELTESGRDRLSMDRVAKRAGVSKTTVYTRWRSKDDLLVAAYRQVSRPFPTLDTGTLKGDFDLLWQTVLAGAADNRYGIVMAELLSAASTNPDLRPVLRAVADSWNAGIEAMLRAGQERGELGEDVDVPLLTDAIVSITLRRLLFQLRPIDETLRADIDTFVFHSPPRRG
jgi:AcrR family transcriptional regulator